MLNYLYLDHREQISGAVEYMFKPTFLQYAFAIL